MHAIIDENVNLDSLAGRIRAARKAKRLTVSGAARSIGVSRTSFSLWESGIVSKPDGRKLFNFSKLTEISLDWLMERNGPDPVVVCDGSILSNQAPMGQKDRISRGSVTRESKAPSKAPMTVGNSRAVPEISASLETHATMIGGDPEGLWVIPDDVVRRGFNAQPGKLVVQQVTAQSNGGIKRGDYILIDVSRTAIDEPGLYLLADPERKRARRALVTPVENGNGGSLKIVILGDDNHREIAPGERVVALGRVMGIIHPV